MLSFTIAFRERRARIMMTYARPLTTTSYYYAMTQELIYTPATPTRRVVPNTGFSYFDGA